MLNNKRLSLLFRDEEATFEFGKQIGLLAKGGEVIGLIGPLGSGKTVFVPGLASGLLVTQSAITSPTFVIMNLYKGRLPLCHIDLYRLDTPIETIGLEEYLEWEGVTAIEWADKAAGKPFSFIIEFAYAEGGRKATLNVKSEYTYLIEGLVGAGPCGRPGQAHRPAPTKSACHDDPGKTN